MESLFSWLFVRKGGLMLLFLEITNYACARSEGVKGGTLRLVVFATFLFHVFIRQHSSDTQLTSHVSENH